MKVSNLQLAIVVIQFKIIVTEHLNVYDNLYNYCNYKDRTTNFTPILD